MNLRLQAKEDDINSIVKHMGSMIDEMMSRNFFRSSSPDSWQPAVNVYEAPDRFIVCADLAGMRRESIDIRPDDDVLHVRGTRDKPEIPDPPGEEEISVHLMEIDSGKFHRRVPIPPDVIQKDIRATYRNGYVWIVMPRKQGGGQ